VGASRRRPALICSKAWIFPASDEDAAFWRETVPHRAAAAAPVIIEQRQARRDRRAIQTRRSQFLERAWIYSALIAAFAVVIGISVG
jgi:hypothetical protein